MKNERSVAAHWPGGFDEAGLQGWAEGLRRQLDAPKVSLGLVFTTPQYFSEAEQLLELLQVHARIPLLAGCSSGSLICGDHEIEENAGLVLGLYALPGADLRAVHFSQEQVEESSGPGYWHLETGITGDQTNGWLAFVDPFHLDGESWLRGWNEAYPEAPVIGGLASGGSAEQRTQVYLNGKVFEEGGVAVSVGGEVKLSSVISQGCNPIGDTWTITKTEKNLIREIANRPAYQVLVETYNGLSPAQKKQARGNILVGLAVNEYLDDFHRGDFLVRNLLGADPMSGVIAVGAFPRPGQTMQFQCRAATAGTEDIEALLLRTKKSLAGREVFGGCLCCCNGRGKSLFGVPDHDAGHVQKALGPLGLTGFFCNGEIGPVGEKNFLHGFTASLGLFVKK